MPNSVLWVCLVAVWLFVLVPMVIKGRPEVRTTTRATLATRVLDRGGAAMSRATRRVALGRHPHDADWVAPVREYLKPGELINDDDDHAAARAVRDPAVEQADPAETAVDTHADADSSAGPDLEAGSNDAHPDDAASHDSGPEDAAPHDADADDAELEDTDVEDATGGDFTGGNAAAEEGVDTAAAEGDGERATVQVENVARRGRGGYDADADSRRIATRYRARQRLTAILGVVAAAGLGVGVVVGGIGWTATGIGIGSLVAYLAFLRRTVRMEEQIRRRRRTRAASAGRVARARPRQFDDVGDPFEDEIPSHLRRPGAVVLEIDDEHPVFDHLPPFQRRRVTREEPEFRRAAGQ